MNDNFLASAIEHLDAYLKEELCKMHYSAWHSMFSPFTGAVVTIAEEGIDYKMKKDGIALSAIKWLEKMKIKLLSTLQKHMSL